MAYRVLGFIGFGFGLIGFLGLRVYRALGLMVYRVLGFIWPIRF